MPTDFAPRKTATANKRGSRRKTAKRARGMAFSGRSFAGGAVCGAVAMLTLIYGPRLTPLHFGGDADLVPADPAPAKPTLTYEFMRRLPHDEVVTNVTPYQPPQQPPAQALPKPSASAAATTAEPVSPIVANVDEAYLLQVAAFRSREDADELRAELILDGLGKVAVNTASRSGGETMYRVLVGPVPEQELARTRATLRARDIAPLLVNNAPG